MENLKEKFTNSEKVRITLQRNYDHACSNPKFKNFVHKIGITKDEAMKNTSKLEKILFQLEKCRECKGIFECSSDYEGNVEYPKIIEDKLYFTYTPCRYMKEIEEKKEKKKTEGKIISNARMKDIDITDKNRVKVIKWLKNFYDKYDISKNMKGLYLHGNFGCGKTFLISCLLNELKVKKNPHILMVGLGNNDFSSDALGPLTIKKINANSYVYNVNNKISCIIPGVMKMTGLESASIIKSLVNEFGFDLVIVFDALATKNVDRLFKVIQVTIGLSL